jgi:hypothetical protein
MGDVIADDFLGGAVLLLHTKKKLFDFVEALGLR